MTNTPFDPMNALVPMVVEQTSKGERSLTLFSPIERKRNFLEGQVEDHMANLMLLKCCS